MTKAFDELETKLEALESKEEVEMQTREYETLVEKGMQGGRATKNGSESVRLNTTVYQSQKDQQEASEKPQTEDKAYHYEKASETNSNEVDIKQDEDHQKLDVKETEKVKQKVKFEEGRECMSTL